MIIDEILALDQKYQANNYNGIREGTQNYQVILGMVPILVSAPHTVNQMREGGVKEQDGITGGIAEYLCQRFGTFGVIRTWNDGDDPNYADDEVSDRFRRQIVRLVQENNIRWTFDIHGILGKYGIDVDLGVNEGKNVACGMETIERIVKLWPQDLVVKIDEPFQALSSLTVSNYVHRMAGVNCVQIELGPKVRVKNEGMKSFLMGFEKLIELILVGEI